MSFFSIALLCLSLYRLSTACTRDELVLLQVISNHGSSAPDVLYPTDPNPQSFWREGLGQLTMLGKFQSFVLGAYLRARYNGFITSDPVEVEVHSSPSKSCVMSALSEISSLYAPTFRNEVIMNFPWQPIMVHYDAQDDKVFSSSLCPTADREYRLLFQSPEAQQFLFKYKYLLDYWSSNTGWNIKEWDAVRTLHTVLETELAYNLTVPSWATNFWNEMKYISDMSLYWQSRTKLLKRLRGGPLIKLMIEKMKKKTAGSIPEKKVYLYSTHQENLAAFLNTLNLFNGKEPPACATVVVELYKHANEYYVRMLYLNSTTPQLEPQFFYLMNLDGCTEFCPMDYILDYTRQLIPDNWDEECELK